MCAHRRLDKLGRALLMATAGVMAAGLLAANLAAQNFVISQNGKSVGTAKLSVKQGDGSLDSASETKIDMPGLKYTFSSNVDLDGSYHIRSVKLDGSVNGTAATVTAQPRGQEIDLRIDANGKKIDTPLAFHPSTIFYPDFDPGALQALLNLGAAHNNRDLWALVPKQSGSVAALRVVTNADMQGTLDGKTVAVHHFTVTGDTGKTEVFSDPTNALLQAEWTDEGFAMVRKGFKLTPPARPTAAPPAAPPQQPAGNDNQPQNQP
jgi:uncharacterized protein DUF6134